MTTTVAPRAMVWVAGSICCTALGPAPIVWATEVAWERAPGDIVDVRDRLLMGGGVGYDPDAIAALVELVGDDPRRVGDRVPFRTATRTRGRAGAVEPEAAAEAPAELPGATRVGALGFELPEEKTCVDEQSRTASTTTPAPNELQAPGADRVARRPGGDLRAAGAGGRWLRFVSRIAGGGGVRGGRVVVAPRVQRAAGAAGAGGAEDEAGWGNHREADPDRSRSAVEGLGTAGDRWRCPAPGAGPARRLPAETRPGWRGQQAVSVAGEPADPRRSRRGHGRPVAGLGGAGAPGTRRPRRPRLCRPARRALRGTEASRRLRVCPARRARRGRWARWGRWAPVRSGDPGSVPAGRGASGHGRGGGETGASARRPSGQPVLGMPAGTGIGPAGDRGRGRSGAPPGATER